MDNQSCRVAPHEESKEWQYSYTTLGGQHSTSLSVTINVVNGESRSNAPDERQIETKVYLRRWYILAVFSLIAAIQGGYWNTWGPIAATSEHAFGWTDATIALLSNWGPIAYIISGVFFSWLIDVKGLRVSMLLTGFLVCLGAGVRCITYEPPYVTWTVHIGQLLNGLGGPIAMGLPPALSAVWFPPHERTTATAIATVFNGLGVGASFLVGPYMVPERSYKNQSLVNTTVSTIYFTEELHTPKNLTDEDEIINLERKDIIKLMYIEFGVSAFAFLLSLLYFPEKPPSPPSKTAKIERLDFKMGLLGLVRNGRFWLICLIYGLPLGVFNCWQSVLDVNLKPHNISEHEAGWIGFYSILGSTASALIVARFADVFSKHMKLFLIILYTSGAVCIAWFTVLVNGFIPNSIASLYVSVILATMLLNAAPPLFYEMSCEVTYPVAEGVTNVVLTLMNNVGGLLFLLVQMVPHIGTAWENWTLLGTVVVCIPVMFVIRESYNRLNVDETQTDKK